MTALVNDTVIGSGSTGQMEWSLGEVISYISRGVTLAPGDVIGSGTVPTCTLVEHLSMTALDSFPGWLHDGDVVTLQVEGLGETRLPVRRATRHIRWMLGPTPMPCPRPVGSTGRHRTPCTGGRTRSPTGCGRGRCQWRIRVEQRRAGRRRRRALLVDTLFDLALTREMLTAMKPITDRAPITDALITHSNGDHTHGNQLLDASVRIIAAKAPPRRSRTGWRRRCWP